MDDRVADLLALRMTLEPLGERLVEALTADEAVERASKEEFAVILLDVQMPGIDGLEVARRLREEGASRRSPLIFLTSLDHNRENTTAALKARVLEGTGREKKFLEEATHILAQSLSDENTLADHPVLRTVSRRLLQHRRALSRRADSSHRNDARRGLRAGYGAAPSSSPCSRPSRIRAGEHSAIISNGTKIQFLIAECHGRHRLQLGWTANALIREWAILREEIERVVRRHALGVPEQGMSEALSIIGRMFEQGAEASCQAFNQAADHAAAPGLIRATAPSQESDTAAE